ncbi:MAG: DNA adenine methylase [Armatimonadetes bacterium]|nr:DNA adenine methylase [Armatimonadota bacterium]
MRKLSIPKYAVKRFFDISLSEIVDNYKNIDTSVDSKIQGILDIQDRVRTNLFPWRGQFSPQLVEHFIKEYAYQNTTILDPFCGSGTTLAEAIRQGLSVIGYDINPAAYLFSLMHSFANLSIAQRKQCIETVSLFIKEPNQFNLFTGTDLSFDPKSVAKQFAGHTLTLFTVALMQSMENSTDFRLEKLKSKLGAIAKKVLAMPLAENPVDVAPLDSRYMPLGDQSIDLIITSPPYINVFNYHQNYRPALELLGWKPLHVAPTEIGANRKHRGNRFFTVIQYCQDMAMALLEMGRILKPDGRIVIVVGRCSSVRGVSFRNGLILLLIAEYGLGYKLESLRERSFMNRFGERIYEDIIVLNNLGLNVKINAPLLGIDVGCWALEEGYSQAQGEVIRDIEAAIERAPLIQPSPQLQVEIPANYKAYKYGLMVKNIS